MLCDDSMHLYVCQSIIQCPVVLVSLYAHAGVSRTILEYICPARIYCTMSQFFFSKYALSLSLERAKIYCLMTSLIVEDDPVNNL